VRIGETAEDLGGLDVLAHGEHERAREPGHPLEEPRGCAPTMKGKVGGPGTAHDRIVHATHRCLLV
jgi:hypothetical protein